MSQYHSYKPLCSLCFLWASLQLPRFSIPVFLGASSLIADFNLSASSAGLLAAIYFPVYAATQLPGGLLADRIHCSHLLRLSSVGLILITALFAISRSFWVATVIKAISGFIDAVIWQAILKQLSEVYKEKHTKTVAVLVAGQGLGQIVALVGLPLLLTLFSWSQVTLISSIPLILAGLALWIYNPMYPRVETPPAKNIMTGIYIILRNSYFWPIVTIAALWNGGQFGLLTWLPSFARDVLDYNLALTGSMPALMSLGVVFGGVIVSKYISEQRKTLVFILGAVATCIIQIGFALTSNELVVVLWVSSFSLGVLFAIYFMSVPIISSRVPSSYGGAAIGTMNTINFLPAFFVPWLMGVVLDNRPVPTTKGYVSSSLGYRAAFLLPGLFLGLALLVSTAYLAILRKKDSRNDTR